MQVKIHNTAGNDYNVQQKQASDAQHELSKYHAINYFYTNPGNNVGRTGFLQDFDMQIHGVFKDH